MLLSGRSNNYSKTEQNETNSKNKKENTSSKKLMDRINKDETFKNSIRNKYKRKNLEKNG